MFAPTKWEYPLRGRQDSFEAIKACLDQRGRTVRLEPYDDVEAGKWGGPGRSLRSSRVGSAG